MLQTPRRHLTRAITFTVLPCAATAMLLTGCSGDDAPEPAGDNTTGSASAAPNPEMADALNKTAEFVTNAGSVHILEQYDTQKGAVRYELSGPTNSSDVTISSSAEGGAITDDIIVVGEKAYAKRNLASWEKSGATKAAVNKLGYLGKYVEEPAQSNTEDAAQQVEPLFPNAQTYLKQWSLESKESLENSYNQMASGEVDGQQVHIFSDTDGGSWKLHVLADGSNQPILFTADGQEYDDKITGDIRIEFSKWGEAATPTAPPSTEVVTRKPDQEGRPENPMATPPADPTVPATKPAQKTTPPARQKPSPTTPTEPEKDVITLPVMPETST